MDIFTEATKARSRRRELTISPFGTARQAPSRMRRQHPPTLNPGGTPMRAARRDLQMFALRPSGEPSGHASLGRRDDAHAPLQVAPSVVAPPVVSVDASDDRPTGGAVQTYAKTPAGAASGVRLTTRGYKLLLGVVAGAIVLCSAATVGGGESTPSVAATQVVARGGESVEAVAERAADGRDVAAVAQLIRSANGIEPGEQLRAGDIVLVPGS